MASLTILVRPRVRAAERAADGHARRRRRACSPAVFLIGIYGGYFGAAAGVMLLALLLVGTDETLARSNALKNVVLGDRRTSTAALGFIVFGRRALGSRSPRSRSGCSPARRLGPVVVRHSDADVLRALIGVAGLALAVKLGVDAY